MAKVARQHVVVYRSTQWQMVKNEETGVKEKKYPLTTMMPSRYISYGDDGVPVQKIYSLISEPDPKSGKLVPREEKIQFNNGELVLVMPKDKTLMDFLDNSPYLESMENRRRGHKILFEKVDHAKEKAIDVSATEKIVKAFNLIETTELIDLVEYAKALALDVEDVEELLAEKGKKNFDAIRKKEPTQLMLTDLKRKAKDDPAAFIKGLSDPLRAPLATIKEAVQNNVITFDNTASQYCWVMGLDRAPIQNIPKGVEHEKWFAQWLIENNSTLVEVKSRIELSKDAVYKT